MSPIVRILSYLIPVALLAQPPVSLSPKRIAEFRELRFGMFICWSFSTFSEKEWTPGIQDVSYFHPTGFDAGEWARTAKRAGMKYILLLTKHHDGFCLWDTRTTERKVTRSPLGRDVVAGVRKACERNGLKLALYYSEGDWMWPGATDGASGKGGQSAELKKAQLKELLTGYGPIEFIWFDHAIGDGGLRHKDTTDFVKSLQPNCLVGYNHGEASGDLRLGEMGHGSSLDDLSGSGYNAKDAKNYSGYAAAEFTYPIVGGNRRGTPQFGRWFFTRPEWDDIVTPASEIYRDYLGAAKHGNLFSLDVAPTRAGKLRKIDVKTLEQVGRYVRRERAPSDGQAGRPVPRALRN
ncbi:MAG: alpha-L-fucosidase [Acidobacteria bacterium]|nr:alpha-L-fucosidase [Acidobacteriota bacterium]